MAQAFSESGEGQIGLELPLEVVDNPDLEYRGVMIDTSRHFYSVESIKGLI